MNKTGMRKANKKEVNRMTNILFVEDDDNFRQTFSNILIKEGYNVQSVSSPIEAALLVSSNAYDLIISDLIFKDFTGIQFLEHLKKAQPQMQTIILTGSPDVESEMESLEINVDKYLEKGMPIELILKHIETLVGRKVETDHKVIVSHKDGITLDPVSREVTKDGEVIDLTQKEYLVFKHLFENKGKAISRDELIEQNWEKNVEVIEPRVVDVHVKSIRRKLNTYSLVTIRGFGYRWQS